VRQEEESNTMIAVLVRFHPQDGKPEYSEIRFGEQEISSEATTCLMNLLPSIDQEGIVYIFGWLCCKVCGESLIEESFVISFSLPPDEIGENIEEENRNFHEAIVVYLLSKIYILLAILSMKKSGMVITHDFGPDSPIKYPGGEAA